jgi:hypothetical protein
MNNNLKLKYIIDSEYDGFDKLLILARLRLLEKTSVEQDEFIN